MRLLPLTFGCLLLAVSGCGGGGGSTGTGGAQTAKPQVQLEWGQRSRGITGPGSAQSAVIVFDKAGKNGTDVSFEVDRSSNPADYTQTYACPSATVVGTFLMHVLFQSQTGGTGSLVAEADLSVQMLPNGALQRAGGGAIGTVKATGTITGVTVQGSQTVYVAQPADLVITARDIYGAIVSLTPGSVFYQVTPGTGTATVDSTGHIVGGASGTVYVSATVDGIASSSVQVTVSAPPLPLTSIAQATNDMVLDSQTGHLWASVPSSDTVHGNSVIEIDPATGKLVSAILVGSEPSALAISDDGSALYVSLKGANKIARVDPVRKTVVSTFDVTAGGSFVSAPYAYFLAVQPGNPNVVAASEQDVNDSGFLGPCIFNNGTLLPNNMGIYNGEVFAFTSASVIWASDPGFSPEGLFEGSVDSNGATMLSENRGLGGSMKSFGGNLYFENGQVVSGTDGTLMGTFTFNSAQQPYYADVTVDLSAHRAFFTTIPISQGETPQLQVFDTTTYLQVASAPIPSPAYSTYPPSNFYSLTRVGAKGLAFRDGQYIYFAQQAPGL